MQRYVVYPDSSASGSDSVIPARTTHNPFECLRPRTLNTYREMTPGPQAASLRIFRDPTSSDQSSNVNMALHGVKSGELKMVIWKRHTGKANGAMTSA